MRQRGSLVIGGDMWAVLGIAPTTDPIEIRRAYARRMKESDVGEDAEAFAELRAAREAALAWAAGPDVIVSDADFGSPMADGASHTAGTPAEYCLAAPVLNQVDVADGVSTIAPVCDDEPDISATPPFVGKDTLAGDDLRLNGAQWAAPELDVMLGEDGVMSSRLATDDDYQSMAALLFPEKGGDAGPMTAGEISLWLMHLDRVFGDPRMNELGFFGDVERWLSEVLAGSVPRSDPLLATVADHFGWMGKPDDVGEIPAISHITARVAALSFVDAVRTPGHRYRRAWRELTTPADVTSHRGWVRGKRVLELLETVRQHHPQLEQSFDWYRIRLWEGHGGGGSEGAAPGLVIAGLVLAFSMLRIFADLGGDKPAPTPASPAIEVRSNWLDAPANDIPAAIEWASNGVYRPEDLDTRNPELLEDLRQIWAADKVAGERRDMFENHVADHLRDRFPRIAEQASSAALADLLRIRIEAARRAGRSAQDCADEILGRKWLPPEYDRRYRAAQYRILIETRGKMRDVDEDGVYWVDDKTIAAAAKRAGMSIDDFSAGLKKDANPGLLCDARVALMETALTLPRKKAMKLLPHL